MIMKTARSGSNTFSCRRITLQISLTMVGLLLNNILKKNMYLKSSPATKDCDIERDKGCKITKPDKIGEERIYVRKITS